MSVLTRLSATRGARPTIYLTCKWGFTPQAKEIVDLRLAIELGKKYLSAQLNYDYDKYIFSVSNFTAPSFVIVYTVSQTVIDNFVAEQLSGNSDYEASKSSLLFKIAPLVGGENENNLEEPSEDVLIKTSIKAGWSCLRIEQLVERVFHEKLLKKIAELTGCTLSYHSESRKIIIIGSIQEDCDRCIQKLDRTRDYDVPRFEDPLMNRGHCLWAEENEEFAPAFLAIPSIHTLYETTLLDVIKYPDDDNCYFDLSKASILRCCLYDEVRRRYKPIASKKPTPAVKAATKEDKSKVFRNYKYGSKGDATQNPMNNVHSDNHPSSTSLTGIPIEKQVAIEGWVRDLPSVQLPSGDHLPAGKPSTSPEHLLAGKPSTSPDNLQAGKPSTSPDRLIAGEQSTSPDHLLAGKPATSPDHLLAEKLSTSQDHLPAGKPSISPSTAAFPNPQVVSNNSLQNGHHEIIIACPPCGNLQQPIREDHQNHIASSISNIRIAAPRSPTLLDSDLGEVTFKGFPNILEPSVLVVLRPQYKAVTERLQIENEVASREFHSTMGQKAPKGRWEGDIFIPTPPPTDLTKIFVDQLQASVFQTLRSMRNWQGEVELKAQFGRIWANRSNHKQFASDSAHLPWTDVDKLLKSLHGLDRGRPIVGMTDILTCMPAESQYLVDLNILNANPYWKPTPKWTICYQFQCLDPSPSRPAYVDSRFMMEVDSETFNYKVHSIPHHFGDCHVHCIKRNWDYRITATGTKNLKEEYGSFAENLVKSLYIPTGKNDQTLWMSFQLPSDQAFHFPTLRIAKKCIYTSADGKSKLNITEFRDMHIESHTTLDPEIHEYKAWTRTAREDSHQEYNWFEASISSTKGEEFLRQNSTLELGEETVWRVQDFKKEVVLPALYRPACAMIKEMDGVGAYNENPFGNLFREREKLQRQREAGEGSTKTQR